MTLAQIIDQVFLNVYQGKPSDDSELSRAQVLSWACYLRDDIVKQYLDLTIRNGKPFPTEYQIRETGVAAQATNQ
jgi:hypothetical protein